MNFTMLYRPTCLDQLWLTPGMRDLLQVMLQQDTLNVLVVGGAATGKTTLLEVLLSEYFGGVVDPRNVLRITSLKEQGLQFFRQEVKLFCQTYSVVPGRKKCVVLDDLDQVPEQSQQVFRHFVDRYSHRVQFLASCANPHKVIENLHSRLQGLPLDPLPEDCLRALLDWVCAGEALTLEPAAQDFLVSFSRRTSNLMLHSLEKIILAKEPDVSVVTLANVQEWCCDISPVDLERLTDLLLGGPQYLPEAVALLRGLADRGFSVMDVLDSFYAYLRQSTQLTELQKHNVIPIICKFIAIFQNWHEDDLELVFFANQVQQVLWTSRNETEEEEQQEKEEEN